MHLSPYFALKTHLRMLFYVLACTIYFPPFHLPHVSVPVFLTMSKLLCLQPAAGFFLIFRWGRMRGFLKDFNTPHSVWVAFSLGKSDPKSPSSTACSNGKVSRTVGRYKIALISPRFSLAEIIGSLRWLVSRYGMACISRLTFIYMQRMTHGLASTCLSIQATRMCLLHLWIAECISSWCWIRG